MTTFLQLGVSLRNYLTLSDTELQFSTCKSQDRNDTGEIRYLRITRMYF